MSDEVDLGSVTLEHEKTLMLHVVARDPGGAGGVPRDVALDDEGGVIWLRETNRRKLGGMHLRI